jgi:Uri superfamily endonuclease
VCDRPSSLPEGGLYQLLIRLDAPTRLRIGALGEWELAAGWYVYTGSAKRCLPHRVARHRAAHKPLRWHIDYLTSVASVVDVHVWPLGKWDECGLHRALLARPGVSEPVRGFGSSDCRCRSHLARLEERAAWDSTQHCVPGRSPLRGAGPGLDCSAPSAP